ncbi:TolB family protein [Flagellimonas algarum]|uniref:TolB family protein n=1 Tax=Flagellimonas algarum TaxID=3230298 RepID=UPI003CD0C8CE
MMKADGSEQTRLEPLVGGSPFFTPDGRIVYSAEYANKKSEICIANSNGSGIVQLTDNEADEWHPDVSADGQYIAFMSDRDGNFEVYTMKIDGSDAKRLTHDEVDNWYPSWSADGAKLMYSIKTGEERKDRDIYIMDADGASVEKIISKGSQAAWMK